MSTNISKTQSSSLKYNTPMFSSVYSLPACLISHYSKLIAGKLEVGGGGGPQSWQKTEFLSALMWGSDVYDGFPVINQTAACLSLGWPPVQGTPASPGGPPRGLSGAPPLPISLSFHPPPPDSYLPLILRSLRWWGSPSAEVLKKGAGGEAGEQKIQNEKG